MAKLHEDGPVFETARTATNTTGKAIVLCSDGTGNARGRSRGTNVGRIFKATDLSANQIAFYDDGVGTQENKYIKAFAAGFGWGLTRNVLQLYEFLCRNYDSQANDRVYLFGFSRGAYTVRVLAGLITACGIVDTKKPNAGPGGSLKDVVNDAYRAYRKSRDHVGPNNPADAFRKEWALDPVNPPPIHFIGVWDTVDAVGLPVDEMTTVLDRFYKFRFTNHRLGDNVKKACHAIAIDDERRTFHPVLWDETFEAGKTGPDEAPRIEQVWFAGMHSNVGGGYAKDELAYIPLEWMMSKAAACGLTFHDEIWDTYWRNANANGKMYDSRSRAARFYRYRPRDIIGFDSVFTLQKPILHESVIRRIQGTEVDYAPLNIPPNFRIASDTRPTKGGIPFPPAAAKAFQQNTALAWWRQVLYVWFLFTVGLTLAVPLLVDADETVGGCSAWMCWLEPVFGAARMVTGDLILPWLRDLAAAPYLFAWIAFSFIAILTLHILLVRAMKKAGMCIWSAIHGKTTKEMPTVCFYHDVANFIRHHEYTEKIVAVWNRWVLPWGTAAAVPAIVIALAYFINDANTTKYLAASGADCTATDTELLISVGEPQTDISFATSKNCHATGFKIESGRTYVINIEDKLSDRDKWVDLSIPGKPPRGFSSWEGSFLMNLTVPLRRHIEQPWFQLMGKIGRNGTPFPITSLSSRLPPNQEGELFLYLNDAVCAVCPTSEQWYFYKNNKGNVVARISVERPN